MATRIIGLAQNAAVDAVVDRVDLGATDAAGDLEIRTGTQPADADDAATGSVLATFTLSNPAFAAAAAGSAAIDVTPALSVTATGTGTAGWFRIRDRNNAGVIDGNITATGGGGDIELDSVSITSGQTVNITALNVSIPASE